MLPSGEWVRVRCPEGCLLVNTGEVLRAISNDTWPSARHYVGRNWSSRGPRYSLAFFLSPAPDVPVGGAPSCVSPARPARYRPTTWLEGAGRSRGGFLAPAPAAEPPG